MTDGLLKPNEQRNAICRSRKSPSLSSPIICLSQETMILLQDYMIKMEINSIRLDMKLVFEITENVGSADVNSPPNANRTPKHGKVLNVIFTKLGGNAVSLTFVDKRWPYVVSYE